MRGGDRLEIGVSAFRRPNARVNRGIQLVENGCKMSDNEFHDSTDCSRADGPPDAINPNVPGTPDILAELRDRANLVIHKANFRLCFDDFEKVNYAIHSSYKSAAKMFIGWLDELAQPNDNTARSQEGE